MPWHVFALFGIAGVPENQQPGQFRHLVAGMARSANGPTGQGAIDGQPDLGVARAARHVRQGGASGRGTARAIAGGTDAVGGSRRPDLAGDRFPHLARVHLHFDDERDVRVLPQHVAQRRECPRPGDETETRRRRRSGTPRRPAQARPPCAPPPAPTRTSCDRASNRDERPARRRRRGGHPARGRLRRPACRDRTPASVFSGPSAHPPRCAKTRGLES